MTRVKNVMFFVVFKGFFCTNRACLGKFAFCFLDWKNGCDWFTYTYITQIPSTFTQIFNQKLYYLLKSLTEQRKLYGLSRVVHSFILKSIQIRTRS